jgi:hypothetical protein
MKNVVFWDVTLCGFCMNRRFGGMYRLHHQDDKNGEIGTILRSVLRLLVTADVVSSSQILSTLLMELIRSPKHRFSQEPRSTTSEKTALEDELVRIG